MNLPGRRDNLVPPAWPLLARAASAERRRRREAVVFATVVVLFAAVAFIFGAWAAR